MNRGTIINALEGMALVLVAIGIFTIPIAITMWNVGFILNISNVGYILVPACMLLSIGIIFLVAADMIREFSRYNWVEV